MMARKNDRLRAALWILLLAPILASAVPLPHNHATSAGEAEEECPVCLALTQIQATVVPDFAYIAEPVLLEELSSSPSTVGPVTREIRGPYLRGPPVS